MDEWTETQAAELEYAAVFEAYHSGINPHDPNVWLETALVFNENDIREVGYIEYCLAKAVYLESMPL